jgi:hypothetical protein
MFKKPNCGFFSNHDLEDFLSSFFQFLHENCRKIQILNILRNTNSNVSKLSKSTLF